MILFGPEMPKTRPKLQMLISPLGIYLVLQNYILHPLNHIHIWQVSSQLDCRGTYQIWNFIEYTVFRKCTGNEQMDKTGLVIPTVNIEMLMLLHDALQWLHGENHGASNQQQLDCLFHTLLRLTTKTPQSSTLLVFSEGNHRWPLDSPHKGASNSDSVSMSWCHSDNGKYRVTGALPIVPVTTAIFANLLHLKCHLYWSL